jgi:hypothetical protein
MSRQWKRHLDRMPMDEQVRLAVSDLTRGTASVRVEVIDHGNIHDLLVYVEVSRNTPEWEVERWLEEVRTCLRRFQVENPGDPCMASWSALFERNGQSIAHASAFDRPRGHVA